MAKVKIVYGPTEDEDGKHVTFQAVTYPCEEQERIYKKITELFGDHDDSKSVSNTASDVVSWCETAVIGDTYDFGPGEAIMVD